MAELKIELEIAKKASAISIKLMQKKLAAALKEKNWSKAGELEAYVAGCEQIEMVYSMAMDRANRDKNEVKEILCANKQETK